MSENTTRFLVGLSIPFGLSAVWFGIVKALVSAPMAERLYTTAPMKYVAPSALIAIVVFLVASNWRTRRWLAYGALATLIPIVPLTLVLIASGKPA